MNECTYLRYLRLKYGFTLDELARAAGISDQHISRAELQQTPPIPTLERKCEAAMECLIAQRRTEMLTLELDYKVAKGRLLKQMEEDGHEL